MKKSLLLVAGTFCAALLMTGCAGISTNNGGVAPISAGPNFYTEVSANAILQPVAGNDYTVVCGINEVTVTLTGTAVKFNK